MWLDPEVARRKFGHQVEMVKKQKDYLHRKGCLLLSYNYPCIDALFLPQKPVKIMNQLLSGNPPVVSQSLGVQIDNLSSRSFGVRINLEGFDLQAPSVDFFNPLTWEKLQFSEIPIALHSSPERGLHQVLVREHLTTHRPFLCLPITREYFVHPEHNEADWFPVRRETTAFRILEAILDTMCSRSPSVSFSITADTPAQQRNN